MKTIIERRNKETVKQTHDKRNMSATTRVLECCKIDFGLQENARIWSELEQDFLLVKQGGKPRDHKADYA